jgi:4-alpha-glucanotransferase
MSSPASEERASGILLHLTSLPGPYGIGDLGNQAHAWVETLVAAGQRWWQVLPVGPTGFGDSPYQSLSTFAGNPNLLSPEALAEDGLLTTAELTAIEMPEGPIDYGNVIARKQQLLTLVFRRFQAGDQPTLRDEFNQFCEQQSSWLDDFALFVALKDHFGGAPWWLWPRPLATREPDVLAKTTAQLAGQVELHRFGQFLFARQWSALHDHARKRGVRLLGDVPIYVAEDSADVWSHPELFALDGGRRPVAVAGVPPDYFSATGQLWGNPVYDWDAHRRTRFAWWIARMRAALSFFDMIRIDHFRGVEAYWAVPAGDATAERGRWLPGPSDELLVALRNALGGLPVVAEDLGFITPEVDALRERFGLPGMRILQFAFGGAVEPRFLPHWFTRSLFVTTGTHDNDTTRGWYDKLTPPERTAYERYIPGAARDPVWSLVRIAWSSVANLAMVPLQDLLGLGSEARLNSPGIASGNWRWRATAAQVAEPEWVERLAEYGRTYDREPPTP